MKKTKMSHAFGGGMYIASLNIILEDISASRRLSSGSWQIFDQKTSPRRKLIIWTGFGLFLRYIVIAVPACWMVGWCLRKHPFTRTRAGKLSVFVCSHCLWIPDFDYWNVLDILYTENPFLTSRIVSSYSKYNAMRYSCIKSNLEILKR